MTRNPILYAAHYSSSKNNATDGKLDNIVQHKSKITKRKYQLPKRQRKTADCRQNYGNLQSKIWKIHVLIVSHYYYNEFAIIIENSKLGITQNRSAFRELLLSELGSNKIRPQVKRSKQNSKGGNKQHYFKTQK